MTDPTVFIDDVDDTAVEEERTVDRHGDTYPKRYWTAGPGTPQPKLVRTYRDTGTGTLKVKRNAAPLVPNYYCYVIKDREEEEFLLKSNMRNRVWLEDIEPEEASMVCEDCSYTCRSLRAMNAHLRTHRRGNSNLAQPRATRSPNALI
jgi:hypothetical protein